MTAVVRLDGSQPVRYGLKLEVDEKYRLMKEQLSELCGVPYSRLLLVEVYGALVKVRGRTWDLFVPWTIIYIYIALGFSFLKNIDTYIYTSEASQ